MDKLLSYNPKKLSGPKALVEYFFNKVNYKESIIIMLVAFIVNFLFYVILGVPYLGVMAIYEFLKSVVVSWFILGFIFYLIAYFVLGKNKMPKKGFEKVLGGLASFKIPIVIYSFFTMAISLIFMPSLLTYFSRIMTNPLLISSSTAMPIFSVWNIIGVVLILLVGLGIFVYLIVMYYHFTKNLFKTKNFWITFAFLILLSVIGFLVSLIIGI